MAHIRKISLVRDLGTSVEVNAGVMRADGSTVWVLSIGTRTSTADNTVTPVNVVSDRPASPFRTSGWLNSDQYDPSGAAMSPDGRTLYVTVPSGLESFRVSWASAAAASAMAG